MLVLLAGPPLRAQDRATITAATELRRGIGGIVLGTLADGSSVLAGKTQGGWAEATVSGWIIAGSVGPTSRDGFDLAVTAGDGENLREEPNGALVARLKKGTLLRKIGARGGWLRVKRTGWVARRNLGTPVETAALDARQAPAPSRPARPPTVKAKSSPQGPGSVAPAGADRADERIELARAAKLVATPDGNPLAALEPGLDGRIVGRAGDWVRVQLEGWVRESDVKPSAGAAMVGVSAAEVRADPQRYVGQTVDWRVQFIAIQTADELRAEIPAGQPFLLTRGPLPEPGFVYVIVPRDQLARFEALPPLQELTLRVTIKAPRTKYLATPVVELVAVADGLAGK